MTVDTPTKPGIPPGFLLAIISINLGMQVICLEDAAFYALIDEVVLRIKEKSTSVQDKWITDVEAMRLLNIKSKTTLQDLRDKGKIRFSQPNRKNILYDRDSIMEYHEANAKNTF